MNGTKVAPATLKHGSWCLLEATCYGSKECIDSQAPQCQPSCFIVNALE